MYSAKAFSPEQSNDPLSEKLVETMNDFVDTSDEIFHCHGPDCECLACETARGLLWVVKNAKVMLEDDLLPFGRSAERVRKYLQELECDYQADSPLIISRTV